MFYIVHVLLGGAIGLHYQSVAIIILVAFVSHFILDIIPHWSLGFNHNEFTKNYSVNFNKKMVAYGLIDAVIALSIIFFLYGKYQTSHILFGCFAAVFPDIISAGYLTKVKNKRKYKKFLKFHIKIQRHTSFLAGILTQILVGFLIVKFFF
jgi:hypothetical protein